MTADWAGASVCAVCDADSADLRCGGCRVMVYCSRECQKNAWPGHKKECRFAMQALKQRAKDEKDDRYFKSYTLETHKGMLSDEVRTEGFREALTEVLRPIQGAIVMDLGCGSGVLSIFAARAGAGHVIAIEANEMAARTAQEVVAKNDLTHKITVFCGRVEVIAPEIDAVLQKRGGKLSLIVSEWMGAALVHEGMLRSVIWARDRWKPKQMMPRSCIVRAVPISHPQLGEATSLDFWQEPHYDIDFSSAVPDVLSETTRGPHLAQIPPEYLLCESRQFWKLDCTKIDDAASCDSTKCDLDFVVARRGEFHGLCLHFECRLSESKVLKTGPEDPPTHWHQTVCLLDADLVAGKPQYTVAAPGDVIRLSLRVQVVDFRHLCVVARGTLQPARKMAWKKNWEFSQKWVMTPNPVIEPVDDAEADS